jgi:hypothetical protein
MSHESGSLPDRSGGDAQSALESAACQLRGTPSATGGTPARQREVLRGRQERDFLTWARENGRLIVADDYLPLATPGGEEHRVWPSPDRSRYWKATHPGYAGFTVIAVGENEDTPDLAFALPLEYLERLLLQNQLFGDEVRLEGVALESGKISIITSQPILIGESVDEEEISCALARLWFKPLPGIHLGRPGSLAFYRDLDEVAAFDAHPGNFVKDTRGIVLPIDLILLRASDALQKAFARFV